MRSGRPPRSATDRTLSNDSDKSLNFQLFVLLKGAACYVFFLEHKVIQLFLF